MIIILQILVILVAFAMVVTVLGGRGHAARAWKKVALGFLAIGMVIAVLFPDITNVAARFVGVGRGADLLLYATVVAFIAFALNNYLQRQHEKDALFRLARQVAILDAKERYKV